VAKLKEARKEISKSQEEGTSAPMLHAKDFDFLAQTKVKMSQRDILKMYVGNWGSLSLVQRRKVMGYVQA